LLLLGSLLAGAVAAGAAGDPARVSLELAGTPLRAALGQLRAAGAPAVAIDADVPDVPVTLNVTQVPWTAALRAIIRAASGTGRTLEFQQTGESYRISVRTAPATAVEVIVPTERPLFLNRGSIHFKNAPLRQVLRRITAETRVRSQVEPQVEDVAVTVQLYARPASELVAATLESAGNLAPGLRYVWDGDRYVIWKCPHGYAGNRKPGDDGNETEPEPGQRIEHVVLRYASVFLLSDLLGAEVFAPTESQLGPQNNNGTYGAGVGQIAAPGSLPAGPGNAFLPTINPPVLTGLCRYSRCGPRYAREAVK
jgi:hypothetical protein